MRRHLAPLAAFLTLLAGAALARPVPLPAPDGAAAAPVPLILGQWQGRVLPVDARAQDILETDDVALLEYRLGSEPPVWLTEVAGLDNRDAFHPPELCYVGSHYQILDRKRLTVMAGARARRVMRLVVGHGKDRFEAWYWFTANGRTTPSYYEQQLWLMGDALAGRSMSGRLIRITTVLDAPEASRRRLTAFLEALTPSL